MLCTSVQVFQVYDLERRDLPHRVGYLYHYPEFTRAGTPFLNLDYVSETVLNLYRFRFQISPRIFFGFIPFDFQNCSEKNWDRT